MIQPWTRASLPICISSASGAAGWSRQYSTLTVDLELQYDENGVGPQAVSRWTPTKLDTGLISQWLAKCRQDHGPSCNELIVSSPPPPGFRCIDTRDWCVTEIDSSDEYLALSYVWAAATSPSSQVEDEPFQLKLANVEELGRKNSLRSDQVPDLIADAIQLCSEIGFRYLWVDRLCIIQDGGALKQEQIINMDAVYHNATMTICVLWGSGLGGIPGTSKTSRKMSLDGKPWQLYERLAVSPGSRYGVHDSAWNTRGWTYQEKVLSRRHLFIEGRHSYLSCMSETGVSDSPFHRSVALDEPERGIRLRSPSSEDTQIGAPSQSPMRLYNFSVEEYTGRKLSFDSDAMNAFMGVANIFAKQHKTALLSCLPERHFFQALLWNRTGEVSRPRVFSNGEPPIPSWSWAASDGTASYGRMRWHFRGRPYTLYSASETLIGNLVRFYHTDLDESSRVRLREVEEVCMWFPMPGESITQQSSGDYAEKIQNFADSPLSAMGSEDSLQLWRDCVHSPWEADRHAEVSHSDLPVALAPGCLVFNSTFALLSLRPPGKLLPVDSEDPSKAPSVNLDMVDKDGNIVGQVFPLPEGEASKIGQTGEEYGVAVLGAAVAERLRRVDWGGEGISNLVARTGETKTSWKQRKEGEDPWALIAIVLHTESGISRRVALGAVNPQAWTDAKPEWRRIVLV